MLKTLKVPTLSKCGVLWGNNDIRTAWTQFADDAAIISESQVEAQNLIYFFQCWTSWANLPIRLNKCRSYGAGKINVCYGQTHPTFHVDGSQIPSVLVDGTLTYLGHMLTFSSNNDNAKSDILGKLKGIKAFINDLQITPLTKVHALISKCMQSSQTQWRSAHWA